MVKVSDSLLISYCSWESFSLILILLSRKKTPSPSLTPLKRFNAHYDSSTISSHLVTCTLSLLHTQKHSSTANIPINNAQLPINTGRLNSPTFLHTSLQSLDSFVDNKTMFTHYGVPFIRFPLFSPLGFRWRACSLSTRWSPRRMIWTSGYICAMSFYDVASRRSCL